MAKKLEDINACVISKKEDKIIILIRGQDYYKKLTFRDKGALNEDILTEEQYTLELENNHPWVYGTKS